MDYKPIIPPVPEKVIEKDKKKDLLKHVNMKQAIADWYAFKERMKYEKEERTRLKSTQMPTSKLTADINNQLGLHKLISKQNTKREGK